MSQNTVQIEISDSSVALLGQLGMSNDQLSDWLNKKILKEAKRNRVVAIEHVYTGRVEGEPYGVYLPELHIYPYRFSARVDWFIQLGGHKSMIPISIGGDPGSPWMWAYLLNSRTQRLLANICLGYGEEMAPGRERPYIDRKGRRQGYLSDRANHAIKLLEYELSERYLRRVGAIS